MIIVDRMENGYAVCEVDGTMQDIPLSKIDARVREGDVLKPDGESARYIVDIDATAQRNAEISELFERLKARRKTN